MSRLERTIVTRGYELDRTGVLPVSGLARYFEHLRWEALDDPAFGLARLFQEGNHTVVRAQRIDTKEAVGHGVELRASLWFGRAGKSSLDLCHRLVRVDGEREVARAVATLVYLTADGRPQELPGGIRSLVAGGDALPGCERLLDPRPRDAWRGRITAQPSDVDLLQHVNHAAYIEYCEDARVRAFTDREPTVAGTARVRSACVEYVGQAVLWEDLEVVAWLADVTPVTLRFEILRAAGERALCRARMLV